MGFKFPVPQVLHPAGLTVVIAKLGGCQVHVPVSVQVPCPYIRNAGNSFNDSCGGEREIPIVFKQYNGSDFIVGGIEQAQNGHQHILVPIAIKVHSLYMSRGN